MKLRKLEQNEHGKTRLLWERIFPEDTGTFLDYYYFIKTRENEIYVIEEDGAIQSMLHLNPYQIQVEEETFTGHYIIAVATEPEYRKRGYMRELLRKTMQDMYRREELFTYLMPAAEEIYLPYDFRFVYEQKQCELTSDELCADDSVFVSDAVMWNAGEMAAFFDEHFSENWQIYAVRDEMYYQSLLFERQSERGGIKLMRENGRLVGMFTYMLEDGVEIIEPLILEGYENDFYRAALKLHSDAETPIRIYACGEKGIRNRKTEKKPLIMARIIRLEKLLAAMHVKEEETLDCSFAVLDSVLPQNSRIWRICGGKDVVWEESSTEEGEDLQKESNISREESRRLHVRETEDSEGVLTIGALTELLFGYRSVEEVMQEESVILTPHLAEELRKIEPLQKIFLNELV